MGVRTWMRRGCFAAAATALAAAALAPTTQAGQLDLPDVFGGYAYATAVHLSLNTDPPQTVPELLRLDLPHGESELGSGAVSRGRASAAYPGSIGDLGTFLCQVGWPCEDFSPPTWPLNARAEYPFQPHGEATVTPRAAKGNDLNVASGRALADAAEDSVSTFAAANDIRLGNLVDPAAELTPETSLLWIGSSQAITKHRFEGDVLVSVAESAMSDVWVAGGALRIGSIVARSTTRSDGGGTISSTPELIVSGATMGGQAVAITAEGIVAGDDPSGPDPRTGVAGFNQLLTNGTLDVKLVGTSDEVDGPTATGTVTGIQITYDADASGFPLGSAAVGGILLGNASTSSRVLPASTSELDFTGGTDFGSGAGDEPGSSAVLSDSFPNAAPGGLASFATPADDVTGLSSFAGADPVPAVDTPPAPTINPGPLERLSDSVSDRVGLLYLATAFAALGLALGVRAPGVRLQ